MSNYKSYSFNLSLTLNANFGGLLFGSLMTVYNPLQDYFALMNGWNDSSTKDSYNGIITALIPIGAVVGAAAIGVISSKLGRKNSLLLADIIGLVGIGLTLISNLAALYIGRILAGVAAGINSVIVPIYVKEMSPQAISGQMGAWFQTTINIGVLISYLWGFGVPGSLGDKDYYWRIMFAFPAIYCILRTTIILFFLNYDSPTSLVQRGQEEEAKRVLEIIYQSESSQAQLEDIKNSIANAPSTGYSILFTSRYFRRLVVGILLCMFQQYSGINAVLFYSNEIFKSMTPDTTIANVLSVVVSIILMFSSFASGLLIDKSGRKTIFLVGSASLFINLFLLGFMSRFKVDPATIVFTFIYCLSFGVSLGPIVWLYLPEILPEKGVSLASLSNWVFTAMIGATFPLMKSSGLNMEGTFWFFSGCMLAAFIFILLLVKETKSKKPEEIEQMFGYDEPLLRSSD